MRVCVSFVLALMLCVLALEGQQGQLDGNETLFTTLAAINAAGYDADLDSPANHPLRQQVRNYVASLNLPSVEKLKRFFAAHAQSNDAAELSQYVSYALLVNGPPAFELPEITYTLPPDVQALEGLSPLLAEFYREADIASVYQKVQPALEEVISRYHTPVAQAVFEINGYLRNPTSGAKGKTFQVVISLLAAPNQIHTRSYGPSHYIVLTPSPEPQIADVRYAYFHYALEQIVTDNQERLEDKRALGDYALGAPHLAEHYKQDFLLLTTASLIKAIEARLAPVSAGDRAVMVDEAYRQGFILAPAFAEQLPAYEKQDRAMRFYFGEMVDAISLAKEEERAQKLEFDQTAPVRVAKKAPVKEPSEVEKNLVQADELYRKRDLDKARALFLQIVGETDEKPLKARAYYGLARIATLRNDPELSQSLFRRVLENEPPPQEKAWTLVYLGRLIDLTGEAEEARKHYEAALAVEGASEKARATAEQGVAGAFRQQRPEQ